MGNAEHTLMLFNSAYHAKYFVNVLNTLAFPRGVVNEYRYTSAGDGKNLSPSAEASRVPRGCRCVIIYVDRWAQGGYRFVPLRWGRFEGADPDGDKQHFRIRLEDYCDQPEDDCRFQQRLGSLVAEHDGPALSGGEPTRTNDGHYAILSDSALPLQQRNRDEASQWSKAVAMVSQTKAFQSHLEGTAVFTRISILDHKERPVRVHSRRSARIATADLLRRRRYSVSVSFRHPHYERVKALAPQIGVSHSENVRLLGPSTYPLDSTAARVTVPFGLRRFAEDEEGFIHLAPSFCSGSESESGQLVSPSLPVVFRARYSVLSRFAIIVGVLGFAFGGVAVGLGEEQFHRIVDTREVLGLWILDLLGFSLQAIAALVLLKVIGNKLL